MTGDMLVLVRSFELLSWLVPRSTSFPRAYRMTVTQRLLDAALDLQEALNAAQNTRGTERHVALNRADVSLDNLRLYLRLAHHLGWLSDGQYHHVSTLVAEVGRLTGGWKRQTESSGARQEITPGQKPGG